MKILRVDRFNYLAMVRQVADMLFEGPYLYQCEPNLRVQLPGETAVDWHTDAEKGHQEEIWNVWVPMTETTDPSQTLWICESPMMLSLGEAVVFRGGVLRHGNKVNVTDKARVSLDFRLLDRSQFKDTGALTVRYAVPIRPGEYWAHG